MTDMTAIARPYAKAAFEFSVKHHQVDTWSNLIASLAAIIADPLCTNFITEPSTTPQQHSQMLQTVLRNFDCTQGGEYFDHFVGLLAQNKRLLAVSSIAKQFENLRAEYEKTLAVELVSAFRLTPEQVKRLTQHLSQRLGLAITVQVVLDPGIIGGLIIRAGDKVWDGSIRTQIKNLGNTLAS